MLLIWLLILLIQYQQPYHQFQQSNQQYQQPNQQHHQQPRQNQRFQQPKEQNQRFQQSNQQPRAQNSWANRAKQNAPQQSSQRESGKGSWASMETRGGSRGGFNQRGRGRGNQNRNFSHSTRGRGRGTFPRNNHNPPGRSTRPNRGPPQEFGTSNVTMMQSPLNDIEVSFPDSNMTLTKEESYTNREEPDPNYSGYFDSDDDMEEELV